MAKKKKKNSNEKAPRIVTEAELIKRIDNKLKGSGLELVCEEEGEFDVLGMYWYPPLPLGWYALMSVDYDPDDPEKNFILADISLEDLANGPNGLRKNEVLEKQTRKRISYHDYLQLHPEEAEAIAAMDKIDRGQFLEFLKEEYPDPEVLHEEIEDFAKADRGHKLN